MAGEGDLLDLRFLSGDPHFFVPGEGLRLFSGDLREERRSRLRCSRRFLADPDLERDRRRDVLSDEPHFVLGDGVRAGLDPCSGLRESLPLLSREAERRDAPRLVDPEGDGDLRLEVDLDLRLEVDLDFLLEVDLDFLLELGPREVDLDLSLDRDLMMKVVVSSPGGSVVFEPALDLVTASSAGIR